VYAPKLVEMGYLEAATCEQLLRDLEEAGNDEGQFIMAPPVFEIVGEKA